jgi:hypothetical protein
MFGFKTVRELISELTIAVRELTARVVAIEQEWDETYDKMTRKAARDRKRARDEATAGPAAIAADGHPIPGPVGGLPPAVAARRRNSRGNDQAPNFDNPFPQ